MNLSAQPLVVKDVTLWIAFFHGILSFFTPCIFPLLPFLVVLLPSKKNFSSFLLFTLGFVLTFVIMGLISSEIGACFNPCILKIIMGILIMFFGIVYTLDIKLLKSKKLLLYIMNRWQTLPAFVLGSLMGAIWIPCSTPILASILAIAAMSPTRFYGALLLFFYALGLLIPFISFGGILSKSYEKFRTPIAEKVIRITGGIFIMVVGFLVITGIIGL